jgi:hypothetical protein
VVCLAAAKSSHEVPEVSNCRQFRGRVTQTMQLSALQSNLVEIPPTALSVATVSDSLTFPPDAMVGSVGDLARVLAAGTEVPEEFYFAAGLTVFGSMCGSDLNVNVAFRVEPRLYTVLLGDSYGVKKSTAMKKTLEFFGGLVIRKPNYNYGVGSAEGLAQALREYPNLILAFDELRAFVDKTTVSGSVLLPMVTALFEGNDWQNTTKNKKQSVPVRNVHLSLIGCCTTATYSDIWTRDAIAIGFPNRLFVVNADRKGKVAWPAPPDPAALGAIRTKIQQQLARLPLALDMDVAGREIWERWYANLPASEHARRLDTIGFRLLALIALTTDKNVIDAETVKTVTRIMDYELNVRITTDPIDADNKVSKLEEKIRRQLELKGPLSERDLRRHTHADRDGLWAFKSARDNLVMAKDIVKDGDKFRRGLLN